MFIGGGNAAQSYARYCYTFCVIIETADAVDHHPLGDGSVALFLHHAAKPHDVRGNEIFLSIARFHDVMSRPAVHHRRKSLGARVPLSSTPVSFNI
jgi:hypothetical protein